MSSLYISLSRKKKDVILRRLAESTGLNPESWDVILTKEASKVRFLYQSNSWRLDLGDIIIMGIDRKLWEDDFSG